MEDQNGKKPFIIPKTHTSNKDVLISEKTDSRNVAELFNDMKSCALELHFDFRQNDCKSCDIIRNQKLQKLYNGRKIQMKKEHDFTERLAFHLITSRDTALNIATDGLSCEQLSFSIDKYLGNPKDGIHLSRRPDVLLASTGTQGLLKFGLLICKIILGKGYATIPSINNKELSGQLHYDYHLCKIQTTNKEQRNINELLANSLVFCYQHEDFKTLSHPSQILPLAILWYDLKEKFSSELISTSQESQKNLKLKPAFKKMSISTLKSGTWDEPIQDKTNIPPIQTITPTKYTNHILLPYSSLYTSFSTSQLDPRLIRTTNTSSETIPLSPSASSIFKQILPEKKSIPLDSIDQLIDPRLKTLKQTHDVFYLEPKTFKHALQQQKRLNNYYGSKTKTNYILIPFHIRSISLNEYERNKQQIKNYSSLHISVIDCFHFGFKNYENQSYIDLEEYDNQISYEQIQISNQLIEQEKELNSQEIRLQLKEKQQRKIQEQIYEQKKKDLANSKFYIQHGRKLLKEHQILTSTNNQISTELLDFFSNEYQQENRPHVKRILAELIGVFNEKYNFNYQQMMLSKTIEASSIMNNQTITSVIDMDLESPSSQGLGDHDERFPEPMINPPLSPSPLVQTYNNTQIDLPISEPINDEILTTNIEKIEISSNEDNNNNNLKEVIISNSTIDMNDNDTNTPRDEFVKLLAKEAYPSKSTSPSQRIKQHRRSNDDDMESISNESLSTTRTVTLVSNNHEDKLIIEAVNTDQQKQEDDDNDDSEQPTVKRIKVDLVSPTEKDDINPLVTASDDHDYRQDLDDRRRQSEASRSRSKSTSSHNSSINDSKIRSPSSSSNRTSSVNNHYRSNRRNEHNRSSYYSQRNINNSKSSYTQSGGGGRHQRFNYNHQSVAEHPRFANVDTLSSPGKNSNYNSFSGSNYSQTNRNLNFSYYQDNYNNVSQPPPLMSTGPLINYSNSYDSKPSDTIERLQMFIQNPNTSYEHRQTSGNDYPTSSNSNNPQWSSLKYPSQISSDTSMHNNQTFTCNDAEQLLSFVQHLRN